jgi:hypothetical protein
MDVLTPNDPRREAEFLDDFHDASESEILAFESGVDALIDKIPIAGAEFIQSVYHALTVLEDRPRWLLAGPELQVTRKPDDPLLLMVSASAGRNVFALRHILERLWNRKPRPRKAPRKLAVDGETYLAMKKSLDLFNDFHFFSHALKGYRTGHCHAKINSNHKRLQLLPVIRNDEYDALNFCLAGPQMEQATWLTTWISWICFEDTRPRILSEITKTAAVSHDRRISYRFDAQLASLLAPHLNFYDPSVPQGWQFPWGQSDIVQRLIWALHLRCMYHLCVIHFTAEGHGIQGGGVDDLCLVLPKGKLVNELHQISGVPLAHAVQFGLALEFGRDTTSPDPALQPLIPLGSLIALPCMMIGGLRFGRNLLALHARLDPKTFDSQSALFEHEMIETTGNAFRAKFANTRLNVKLPRSIGGEELDLLICDPESKTIFVGEARAMIMPADPNEVYRRLTDVEGKVKQLRRKVISLRSNLRGFLGWARLSEGTGNWHVVGAVILRGHAGRFTSVSELPIAPEEILLFGIKRIASLGRLHAWLAGLSWLPVPEKHFSSLITTHQFGDYEVMFGGIGEPKPMFFLNDHLPASTLAYAKT